MDRRYREAVTRTLGTLRSRRHVLATVVKGTVGGVGAALAAQGLGGSSPANSFTPVARAQDGECTPEVCPPVDNPRIRRNVFTLSESEIASLRRGVAVMKQRPQSDPTSWAFQANLHAVPVLMPEPTWCQHRSWFFFPWHRMYLYWFERILREASGEPDLTLPYWNYSDDPALRVLPPAYGEGFDADRSPNPLFEPRRATGINDGSVALSAQTVAYGPAMALTNFFSEEADPPVPSFGGLKITGAMNNGPGGGMLEATPHGNVHVDVGGLFNGAAEFTFATEGTFEYHCSLHPSETARIEVSETAPPEDDPVFVVVDGAPGVPFNPPDLLIPVNTRVVWVNLSFEFPHSATANEELFDTGLLEPPGLMFFPELAARDPIFWLHHANIDRLWERWLALMDGRANPIDQCAWMDQAFSFFREDGSPVSMTVKDVLDTVNCLGYRYDDPLSVFEPAAAPVAVATPAAIAAPVSNMVGETPPDRPIEIGLEPVAVSVELTPEGAAALASIAAGEATPVPGGVAPRTILLLEGIRDHGAPGVTYGVYVNAPPGLGPDPTSDSFVGTIYLFGLTRPMNHDLMNQGARQSFDITRAVRAAQERGEWQGDVVVTFFPQGPVSVGNTAATPAAEAATALAEVPQAPWVTIERMTVTTIE